MDMTPYIGPIVTGLIAAFGAYAACTSKIASLEAQLNDLIRQVEKHNSVIERTYKLESDMATSWKRYDELREEVRELKRGRA